MVRYDRFVHAILDAAFPYGMPADQRRAIVLEVRGYFDESGVHSTSDVTIVAGFLNTPAQWDEFSTQWSKALNDWNLGQFHMTDFANQVPPFADWKEDKRRSLLQRLLDIIVNTAGVSIGFAIPNRAFGQLVSEAVKNYVSGPYGMAAQLLFMNAPDFITPPEAWFAYFLEAGAVGRGQILDTFSKNQAHPTLKEEFRVISLDFVDKRDFLPLQAADILAYELYKHYPNQSFSPEHARYPIRQLVKMPHRWIYREDIIAQLLGKGVAL
mgnify:CR=1 FL=1